MEQTGPWAWKAVGGMSLSQRARAHTIAMATEARRRMRPWVALQWNGAGQ